MTWEYFVNLFFSKNGEIVSSVVSATRIKKSPLDCFELVIFEIAEDGQVVSHANQERQCGNSSAILSTIHTHVMLHNQTPQDQSLVVTMNQKSSCRLLLKMTVVVGSFLIWATGLVIKVLGGTANYKVGVGTIYLCNLYIYIYMYITFMVLNVSHGRQKPTGLGHSPVQFFAW